VSNNSKGYAIGLITAGTIFLYAGIKGKSIGSAIQNLVQGKSPLAGSTANQWTITAAASGSPVSGNPAATGTGAGGTTAVGAYTGNQSQDAVTLGRFLMGHGLSRAAAAGVCGCVAGEAVPPFSPESRGSGGFGLIGWTGNTIGLPSGFSGPTGNVQADWVAECEGVLGYIQAVGSVGDMNAHAPDPVTAANHFSDTYEKPAVLHSDVRASVALSVYASL
jgi:Phage tail lysozyme